MLTTDGVSNTSRHGVREVSYLYQSCIKEGIFMPVTIDCWEKGKQRFNRTAKLTVLFNPFIRFLLKIHRLMCHGQWRQRLTYFGGRGTGENGVWRNVTAVVRVGEMFNLQNSLEFSL